VTGQTYLVLIQAYLQRLRSVHVHHNRVLFYDDVVTMYLVAFFNPVLRSLRNIEVASQLPGVNQHLSVEAVCKSTLSEANALFDPRHLEGLIADLRKHLPNLHQADGKLAHLLKQIEIFDGSFFRTAADVAWAVHSNNQYTKAKGKGGSGYIRLNCQFCLATGSVSGVSINGDDGVGEGAAAELFVEAGHIYLFDSGVVSFPYLAKILSVGSHFLCCLASTVNFTSLEIRALSDADREAGVISDRIGKLRGSDRRTPPDAMVREVIFSFTGRDGSVRTLRLLTDMLDLPAHVVAELYRHRWQIELFFRWLKISATFQHLTSHSRNGITLSFYIAVIATLLMSTITQRPLSKYAYSLLALVAAGLGTVADMLPLLEDRERQAQRQRELQAAKKAAKKRV
jgi:heme exporter protein D